MNTGACLHPTGASKEFDLAAGKTVRIGTLGTESEAEMQLKVIQESCLERAFHISMDRVDYRASDASQVEQEEEEVLQELKELENPEASCYPISLRVVPLDLGQRSIGLRQQPGFKTNRQGAVGSRKRWKPPRQACSSALLESLRGVASLVAKQSFDSEGSHVGHHPLHGYAALHRVLSIFHCSSEVLERSAACGGGLEAAARSLCKCSKVT